MTDKPSDKRKPENNPWYLLATLHGEAASADDAVHARNRRTWNRFMAAELTEGDRTLLIEKKRCSAENLVPFSPEELAEVENLFVERQRHPTGGVSTAGAKMPLPDVKQGRIDFSNVAFSLPFFAEGFLFPARTTFSAASFSREVDFRYAVFFRTPNFQRARFSEEAEFLGSTFCAWAKFQFVTFSGMADFSRVTFSNGASFSATKFFKEAQFSDSRFFLNAHFADAHFLNTAVFSDTRFCGEAVFSEAHFRAKTFFSRATFEKEILFDNTEMKGPTSFKDAKFCSAPPQFFEAKLHQDTVWRGVPPWPLPLKDPVKSELFELFDEAGSFVDAYACLKLEMDRLKKHEDELDFFALELQSRRVLHGDWRPVSGMKLLGRAISLPSLEMPERTITPRPRTLFGRSFTPAVLILRGTGAE